MAKFTSTSLTSPADAGGLGRRIVEDVARRHQAGADQVAQSAREAADERRTLVESIKDPGLRRSVGG